jgi:hypothetical protein
MKNYVWDQLKKVMVPCYKFSMEGQGPNKQGKGREIEVKDKVVRLGRENVSKSMSAALAGTRGNLTS